MRENYIRQILNIHRSFIESHNRYVESHNQYLTILQNILNLENSNNEGVFVSDVFRTTTLPPITIDLTSLFNGAATPQIPTEEEIQNACEVISFSDIPESERNTTRCPIDREIINDDETVLRINHCRHYFREANLRHNFTMNSLCPLCRHNIL